MLASHFEKISWTHAAPGKSGLHACGEGERVMALDICNHVYRCILVYVFIYMYQIFSIIVYCKILNNYFNYSLCYTVNPCCLSILCIVIYICLSHTFYSSPCLSSLEIINLLSMSVSLFLFFSVDSFVFFFRFHI